MTTIQQQIDNITWTGYNNWFQNIITDEKHENYVEYSDFNETPIASYISSQYIASSLNVNLNNLAVVSLNELINERGKIYCQFFNDNVSCDFMLYITDDNVFAILTNHVHKKIQKILFVRTRWFELLTLALNGDEDAYKTMFNYANNDRHYYSITNEFIAYKQLE